jgi:hypothetical protein
MTDFEICNLALLRIGVTKKITSLDDSPEASVASQACALLFPLMRDRLLEEYEWPFAHRRSLLTAAVPVPERGDWFFAYALPADCVVPRDIVPESKRYPWTVEASDDAKKQWLLCNVEDVEISYTARIANPALWPAAFVDALAWRLGAELVMPLAAAPEREGIALRRFEVALDVAQVVAARQGRTADSDPTPSSIAARGC